MSSGEIQPREAPASGARSGPTTLDRIEQFAKIFSLVAIPIVIPIALSIYTAKVQEGAQKESINRDYVQLAVSVLKEKKEDINPGLRDWAVDLLNEHSPTKFGPTVIADLKSGAVSFPDIIGGASSGGKIASVSPDRKLLVVSDGIKITLTNFQTGQQQTLNIAGTAIPVSLDFSPDSALLAVGTSDNSINLLSVETKQEVMRLKVGQPILAVKIAPSGDISVISAGKIYLFHRNGESAGVMFLPGAPTGVSATTR